VIGRRAVLRAAALGLTACPAARLTNPRVRTARVPLRIAYSDWPGWIAWDIGVRKGWFEQEGVPVAFFWFEYLPSMDAFSAGKVDAVAVTNGDALVTGSTGARSKMILVNDYSDGNDQIIGAAGITRLEDLRGKKVGLEVTLVEHLLLTKALDRRGINQSDVEVVNVPTSQTPAALAAGKVAAIGAWYPVAGQARRQVSGTSALFTSADLPGLIYDTLAVNPQSLAARRDDWAKVVKVWYRIASFVRDPGTRAEATSIMAARVGARPEELAAHLSGTCFLSAAEARQRFRRGAGLESLYGSSRVADQFNVTHRVYPAPEAVDEYIDGSLLEGL
jgi:NitT/TauT family transport system substrate-binding protein